VKINKSLVTLLPAPFGRGETN